MFRIEGLRARDQVVRHAQLRAAIANGVMTRHSRKPFSAAELLPSNPWAPPPGKPGPFTFQQLSAQAALINARRRR